MLTCPASLFDIGRLTNSGLVHWGSGHAGAGPISKLCAMALADDTPMTAATTRTPIVLFMMSLSPHCGSNKSAWISCRHLAFRDLALRRRLRQAWVKRKLVRFGFLD